VYIIITDGIIYLTQLGPASTSWD